MDYYNKDFINIEIIFNILSKHPELRIKKHKEKTLLFLEGLYVVMRSGMAWRMIDKKYGKWNSIFRRYLRWTNRGIFEWLRLELIESKLEKSTENFFLRKL